MRVVALVIRCDLARLVGLCMGDCGGFNMRYVGYDLGGVGGKLMTVRVVVMVVVEVVIPRSFVLFAFWCLF